MIVDESVYLEHYGKSGMKWGQRKTNKIQKQIDRVSNVATGNASKSEKLRVAIRTGNLNQKQAEKSLIRSASVQKKVKDGDAAVTNVLLKFSGIKIKDLNYHQN